jgi:DeoD family purine-nucleoside phosphorylase
MHALQDIDLPDGDGETFHLNPAAEFRPNVLLPGDPARAMLIATKQLVEPRMFNHRRGLWGYSGETPGGTGFLTQATGMGGPSAAIVCEELADLGAEVFLRVGTCGSIDPSVKLGDLVIVREAISDDGASTALGVDDRISADTELTDRLMEAATDLGHKWCVGASATVDLFYDPDTGARHDRLREAGALTLEMEAAAVLAVGARRGVRSACLLAVTDELWGDEGRERLSHDEIVELGETLGAVGIRAVETLRAS